MDPAADLAHEAALRLLDADRITPGGDAGTAAWWWNAGSVGCLTRTSGSTLEVALVIDDRMEQLADKEQAADGWREWLRIANALNLREQPTIDHAAHRRERPRCSRTRRSTSPFRIKMLQLPPEWQLAHGQHHQQRGAGLHRKARAVRDADAARSIPFLSSGTRRRRHTDRFRLAGQAKIAVCLDLDADERRVLEMAGWRVFPDDPDAVFAALREAA